MSYRTSEEQPSMMPQRGRGAPRGHLRFPAASPETKNLSFYRSEDQDTSADKTLGFASQGDQSGQKHFSQGKEDGNFRPAREDKPIYRAAPRATGGVARESTIPESKADGVYNLRYCPLIRRNVLVQEMDSQTAGLRDYVIWANHPSATLEFDQWKDISTNYNIKAENDQVLMIFSAKIDRFKNVVSTEDKKTESNSAKKAQKPEPASAVAAMREKTDESKPTQPAEKNKSVVASSTQASEPAQEEKKKSSKGKALEWNVHVHTITIRMV